MKRAAADLCDLAVHDTHICSSCRIAKPKAFDLTCTSFAFDNSIHKKGFLIYYSRIHILTNYIILIADTQFFVGQTLNKLVRAKHAIARYKKVRCENAKPECKYD